VIVTGGPATLIRSTVSGNTAGAHGGGVSVDSGDLRLFNSTISDNSAQSAGGAFVQFDANLVHSTLAFNFATGGVDQIEAGNGLTAANSIFASSNPGDVACSRVIGSGIGNLAANAAGNDASCGVSSAIVGQVSLANLKLDPNLRDNGGATRTHALLPGSAALDAADDETCYLSPDIADNDQRGVRRVSEAQAFQGQHCDVGAYELMLDANGKPLDLHVSTASGTLSGFGSVARPAAAGSLPSPFGFFSFNVTGLTGPSVIVTLQMPPGSSPTGFQKCRKDGSACDLLLPESGSGASTAVISGDTIMLTLVDNDIYDFDPAVGKITDPGAPVKQSSNGGMAFLNANAPSGGGMDLWTLLGLLPGLWRRRRGGG
jgi:hypothetical protein